MSCPCEGLLPEDTIPDPVTGEPIPCEQYQCPDGSESCSETMDAHCVKVSIDIPSLQLEAGDRMDKALLTLGANAGDTNVVSSETNSVKFTGKGVTTDPLKADIKIDAASGNLISVTSNGLLVQLTTEQIAAALATIPSLAYIGSDSVEVVNTGDNEKTLKVKLASSSATAPLKITDDGLTLDFDALKSSLNIPDSDVSRYSQNIVTTDIIITANYNGDANKLYVSGGTITAPSVKVTKSWGINTQTFSSLNPSSTYYLYAQCSKTTQTALYKLSESVLPPEDDTYNYFYLANVYKVVNGRRRLFSYTGSTLTADMIEAGRIVSNDGLSDLDFTNNKYKLGGPTSSISINYESPDSIILKGDVVFQRPGGDTVEFPSVRGKYTSTTVYYAGDIVTYDGQLWRYIYATGAAGHTPIEGDYWELWVSKGSDGSDGSNGQDADPTNYVEFRFQKTASSSVAPQVAATDPEPGGWVTAQPTVGVGEYLWVISATKKSSDNSLVTNWSTPGRITGQRGEAGTAGVDGQKGDKGDNGQTVLLSFVFKRSTTVPAAPTEGSFASPVPTGWSDGVPAGELQLWGSTRIFTSDGNSPQQSTWSAPAAMSDTADLDYEWSSVVNPGNPTDNPTNWTDTASGEDIWMALRKKTNGVWGTWAINKIKGEDGTDAVGIFKSIVFIRTNSTPATPTGGTYASPVPSGWSDGIPSGSNQLWSSSRIFTGNGESPQQAAWSTPAQMTDNQYYDYEWSNIISDPGTPATKPGNWSNTPVTDTIWMAVRPWKNGVYTEDWTVTKIKGEDGLSHYYWVAYGTSISGAGISTDPTGRDYIGIAYNKSTPNQSLDPTDYTWSLYKGAQGVQGPKGDNGDPTYTWIKYADDVDGTNMSDDPTNKVAIGIAVNKTTITESTNPADYKWSLIPKGDKGDTGATGPFMMYRGEYDPAKVYFGGDSRIEAVHYTTTDESVSGYYVSTIAAGSFSNKTPGAAGETYWNKFQGQFETVATSLLLAETAYINNLGVRTVRTADSGRRIEINSDTNSLNFYGSNGGLILEVVEEAGVGSLNIYDTTGFKLIQLSQTGLKQATNYPEQFIPWTVKQITSTDYGLPIDSHSKISDTSLQSVIKTWLYQNTTITTTTAQDNNKILTFNAGTPAPSMWKYYKGASVGSTYNTGHWIKSGSDSSNSSQLTTSDVGVYILSNGPINLVGRGNTPYTTIGFSFIIVSASTNPDSGDGHTVSDRQASLDLPQSFFDY